MTISEWLEQRGRWFAEYSHPPIYEHFRLDLELTSPSCALADVPVEFNPHHHGGGYNDHHCFYVCDDWSVIFNVCEVDGKLRMLVESRHAKPLGEPILLLSTASSIIHEWWAAQQNWNDFALFRGRYWRITWNEYFTAYPFGPCLREKRCPWPAINWIRDIDPRWLTSTVIDLAQTIYQDKAFHTMPILADALMDAGCDNEQILLHCREDLPHTVGCYVLEEINNASK